MSPQVTGTANPHAVAGEVEILPSALSLVWCEKKKFSEIDRWLLGFK